VRGCSSRGGSSTSRTGVARNQLPRRPRRPAVNPRNPLIARFLPLARSLARRYRRGSERLEDLEHIASLALVKAVEGYDPSRETAFSSYAVPSIVGAIKRHFATAAGPSTRRATSRSSPCALLEAREAYRALRSVSLDQPRGTDGDGTDTLVTTSTPAGGRGGAVG
jgi:RNA polymerase sigma-B factor